MPHDLELAREWIDRADHDMQAAALVSKELTKAPEVAVFHYEQAAEKYLKAYLVYNRHGFRKSHNLEPLVDACKRYDPHFESIRACAALLTRYAVLFRYPTPHPLSATDVEEAANAAAAVRDLVDARIRRAVTEGG
jgi:HEPN domain-containing protein